MVVDILVDVVVVDFKVDVAGPTSTVKSAVSVNIASII